MTTALPSPIGSVLRPDMRFTRRVPVRFVEVVSRLATGGAIEIGHSRLSPVPAEGPEGVQRFHVLLGWGSLRSPLPMVLEVTRWSDALGTRLELLPRAHVHAGDRYFESGHALLDAVTAAVTTPRRDAA